MEIDPDVALRFPSTLPTCEGGICRGIPRGERTVTRQTRTPSGRLGITGADGNASLTKAARQCGAEGAGGEATASGCAIAATPGMTETFGTADATKECRAKDSSEAGQNICHAGQGGRIPGVQRRRTDAAQTPARQAKRWGEGRGHRLSHQNMEEVTDTIGSD